MPLISYNAIVRINKNKQQKQVQPHDTWNARHARDTRSMNSASESTGSVRDTSPDNKTSASDNNNSNTILFWWDS